MTPYLKLFWIVLVFFIFSGTGFAQDKMWEKDFISALQKGKLEKIKSSGGLGYTRPVNIILDDAIKKAMEQQAPPCDAMKIAVNLKYNAFDVIKSIFGHGGEIDLDQVCMCATEAGIRKQIIASAATDAVSPMGEPTFQRDEIAQSQCMNDIGLGFTLAALPIEAIEPPERPLSLSASGPTPAP